MEPVKSTALEEVTHAALSGAMRAAEARNQTLHDLPPIVVGLVAWPRAPRDFGDINPDSGAGDASPQE